MSSTRSPAEPATSHAPGTEDSASPPAYPVWPARLLLGCLALTALMFRQAPGLVVPDTKLDLTVDPWGFLARALHLWDPHGFLGQLQNQAYGYLLPVGPFHALLLELGLPAWVVQRLWWSVLLCVAFLGAWRVARALRMGSGWAAYAAAFAYALSPRLLSEVTITSVEVWPMALAPWVLLPLVSRTPLTWWGRIWRSALAVALVGGVNAVATGAVLVLPTLWFLTRRWTREVLLAGLGWLGSVVVAMSWWLVPLLVMGAHSPPFLDWIESARTTTLVAGPTETLRGTSTWLSYLVTQTGPSWPAGRQYVDSWLLVAGSLLIALVGLFALARSSTPHRLFLGVAVGTGLLLVGAGHTGAVGGLLGEPIQHLLDGPLAPLRNTHKFELVVRLPLVLLLAASLTRAARWARDVEVHRGLVPFATACLIAGVAAPALAATLPRPGGYEQIAPHWVEVANWLDAQPGEGTVLVVPAASFAEHTWGTTRDEPLQALMERPFAVRDAVPLGGAGSTRWLDEIQRRLGSGDGGPDLAAALARGGIGWVVVRNDLALGVQETPPVAPHQALTASGLERVADFGPPVGPAGESAQHTVRQRTIVPTPSVQVYAVPDPSVARLVPVSASATLSGGPEDVPGLAEEAPAFLLADAVSAVGGGGSTAGNDLASALDGAQPGSHVLADGYRRRAVNFGQTAENISGMMTAAAAMPPRAVNDYLLPGLGERATLHWPEPIAAVSASSSVSDADTLGRTSAGHDPWRALDGDPATTWVSDPQVGSGQDAGPWWQVDFSQPQDLGTTLDIRVGSPAFYATVQTWQVQTDAGTETTTVAPGRLRQELKLPSGPTSRVRISVLESTGSGQAGAGSVALAEVDLPGLTPVQPTLAVPPGSQAGTPDLIWLRAQQVGRSACLLLGERPLCAGVQSAQPEEPTGLFRQVDVAQGGEYAVTGQVLPVDGTALEDLLREPGQVDVEATSRDLFASYARPETVVDGDTGTGWVAGLLDASPTLTLTLPEARELTGLQLISDYFLPGSRPFELLVSLDGADPIEVTIGENNTATWPAQEVSTVEITFGASFPVTTADPLLPGSTRVLPVGVSEITLLGAQDLPVPDLPVPDPDRQLDLACGSGPDLLVGDQQIRTRVSATAREVLDRSRLTWVPCEADETVHLPAGQSVIQAPADERWLPVDLRLTRVAGDSAEDAGSRTGATETTSASQSGPTASARPLEVSHPDPARVSVAVPARDRTSLVVLAQNAGAGWSADLVTGTGERTPLKPLVVDGWQQGFVVPAGQAGTLQAQFGPDSAYRAGLLGGFAALLVLMVAAWRWRPGQAVPVLSAASPGPAWRLGLVGAFAVLFAGPWGLGAWVLAVLLRTWRASLVATVALLLGLAGTVLLAWLGPEPHGSSLSALLPQVVVLAAVVFVLVAAAGTAHRRE